jgi:hypothetical protein
MEQSFKDENVVSGNNETIEIYMNDGIMKKKSVQIETSKNPKNKRNEEMKINIKKLHVQKKS